MNKEYFYMTLAFIVILVLFTSTYEGFSNTRKTRQQLNKDFNQYYSRLKSGMEKRGRPLYNDTTLSRPKPSVGTGSGSTNPIGSQGGFSTGHSEYGSQRHHDKDSRNVIIYDNVYPLWYDASLYGYYPYLYDPFYRDYDYRFYDYPNKYCVSDCVSRYRHVKDDDDFAEYVRDCIRRCR